MSNSPYPGLRPFLREESDIFFGREEQTDQLLARLGRSRFIAVVGPSGCGKSSLVRAGMIAALETGYLASAGTSWRVVEMRPGGNPLRNLADALVAGLGEELAPGAALPGGLETQPLLLASLRRGPLGLVEILSEAPLPDNTSLLLLVDQFEEIFRYATQGELETASAFVALLLASVRQRRLPIYVVLTMRSDFLGDCAHFEGLPEQINDSQFLIPRLTREQQSMAILGPAGVWGANIEPKLVAALLNEVGSDPDHLPLLQHCLMRMWRVAASLAGVSAEGAEGDQLAAEVEGEITLTLAAYEEVGGLLGALSLHADEAFYELSAEQQRVAEQMFRCLCERGSADRDTRRPASVQQIAEVAGVNISSVIEVAEVFRRGDRCFVTPPAGTYLSAESVLDISHESLARKWHRMNQWIQQEAESADIYRRLEQTALLWSQGHAALWGTPDLENALAWRESESPASSWAQRYGDHFSLAIGFLEKSAAAEEEKSRKEERARQRELERTRRQLALALLGLVLAIGLAVWALWERRGAEKARSQAVAALNLAKKESLRASNAFDSVVKARTRAEIERGRAESALALAEQQTLRATEARVLADEARVQEEVERVRAENALKDALKAQAETAAASQTASRNFRSFKVIAEASFGFLRQKEMNEEFLNSLATSGVIKDFLEVLEVLVETSESMNDEERLYWRAVMPVMTDEQLAVLLGILGTESAKLSAIDRKYDPSATKATKGTVQFEEGVKAEREGRLDEAEINYSAAISSSPKETKFLLARASLYAAKNELEKADLDFRQAIEGAEGQIPSDVLQDIYSAAAGWLRVRRRAGDLDQALELARKTAKIASQLQGRSPGKGSLWRLAYAENRRGAVAERLGLRKEAEEARLAGLAHLRELHEKDPEDIDVLNGLAWNGAISSWYRKNQTLDLALEYAQKAVALSGETPYSLDTLAVVYCVRGEYDLALATYKKLMEKNGGHPFGKTYATIQAVARGEIDPAVVDWDIQADLPAGE